MPDHGDMEIQVYTPEGFDGPPQADPVDLLQRARTVLDEEGRWMQGNWFRNEHPEVDPEDAFCNNWKVCADGALTVVSYGVRRHWYVDGFWNEQKQSYEGGWSHADAITDGNPEEPITQAVETARQFLAEAASEAATAKNGRSIRMGSVVTYNDNWCESRTEMLRIFDRAIVLAVGGVKVDA